MATNIPSHNLGEIADAVVALIRNPLLTIEVYIIRLYTCMLYDILVFYMVYLIHGVVHTVLSLNIVLIHTHTLTCIYNIINTCTRMCLYRSYPPSSPRPISPLVVK